jgi:hypothetical protein
MSEVFNGMNEVPNSKDIISDNRKSNSSSEYGIHLINEPPSHTSYSQGKDDFFHLIPIYLVVGISQPSSDLQNSNFTQSQTVYSSQISSYSTGMEYQNPPQQTTADDQNVIRNSIPSNFQIPFSQGMLNPFLTDRSFIIPLRPCPDELRSELDFSGSAPVKWKL